MELIREGDPFAPHHAERIDGVKLNLAHFSLVELENMHRFCQERIERAQADLELVEHYIELRSPDGPSAA